MTSRPKPVVLALATFAAVFLSLEIFSYTLKSATWDEPVHLTSGYLALTRGDYRLDPEHPPLARVWAALPLLALDGLKVDTASIDAAGQAEWASSGAYVFSHRFLYVDNDADRLLYAARFMSVVFGLLLGVLLFCWAREWLGFGPAVAALAFYAIEPNLAAHASLVTTDIAVTCFMFGTLYFLWRTHVRPSPRNIAAFIAFFTLAILTKFSALILVPIVILLVAIAAVRLRTLTPATACGVVGVLAVTAWLGIWAAYGFRYAPSPTPTWSFSFEDDPVVPQRVPAMASFVRWVDDRHLLPNAFSQGFLIGQAKAQERESFLAGRYSQDGWWYYFPVAFLIKTPIALLVMLLVGTLILARRRRQLGVENVLFVVLPVVVYLGFAMTARINIGLRHLLPIYPFVILLAAVGARELLSETGRKGRLVLGAVVAVWLLEFGRVYPHNLAFFNQLAGGPQRGADYLVDSNLDWGQDLKGLKRWMDDQKVPFVNLAYFGTADPAYYGIDATFLPGGWAFATGPAQPVRLPGYVAISETTLKGLYLNPQTRAFYAPLERQQPVATIGHSIRVYRIERPWW